MLRHGAWLLIPLQALLLQAPAVLAETSQTKFELQLPLSPVCRALSRDCMTPSQWARFFLVSAFSGFSGFTGIPFLFIQKIQRIQRKSQRH